MILCIWKQVIERKRGKNMANIDIRILLQANNIKQYELAEKMDVTESCISKLMRRELKPEQREKVINVIETLIAERNAK